MQIPMTELSAGLPRIPSTDWAREIVKYEPGRIIWSRLVEDRAWRDEPSVKVVHIGTVGGKSTWADGFMLEVAEVPERLKALKKYREVTHDPEGKPRVFDQLVPEITPQHVTVHPLATIVGEKEYRKPDIAYLSDNGNEITAQGKYIDYFVNRYPDAQFLMKTPREPLVVRVKGKSIGVIMPMDTSPEVKAQVREFLRKEAPPEPPIRPPVKPAEITREQIWEMDYNHTLDELKKMAREKGVSPSGTKHEIIRRLTESE